MSIPMICNIAAWIGVVVVGVMLIGDFLKTERQLSKEKKLNEEGTDNE